MHRGARTFQPGAAEGAAGHRRLAAAGGDDRLQRIVAQAEVDGAVGPVARGVDLRRAAQLAVVEGEGHRIEIEDAPLQVGADIDLADVEVVALHPRRLVAQGPVHNPQALDVQRGVGQQAAGPAGAGHGVAGRGDARPGPEHGHQVVDVEQARVQVGVDPTAVPHLVHHHLA